MLQHLINYFPTSIVQDDYSRALINFKKGRSDYVREWTRLTIEFTKNNFVNHYNYIIRVLHSDEVVATGGKALDYLCFKLSYKTGAKYLKNLIRKHHKNSSLKFIDNKYGRLIELENNYFIEDSLEDLSGKKFLIVDDVYTTGASIETITNLLNKHYKNCVVDALVLGKTTHDTSKVNKDFLFFNIRSDYYKPLNYEYPTKYPNYHELGFLSSHHEIFPQEWDLETFTTRTNQIVFKIFLKESKEFFLFWFGNFRDLFSETEVFTYIPEGVDIENDNNFIGAENMIPFIVRKNYSDLETEKIGKRHYF